MGLFDQFGEGTTGNAGDVSKEIDFSKLDKKPDEAAENALILANSDKDDSLDNLLADLGAPTSKQLPAGRTDEASKTSSTSVIPATTKSDDGASKTPEEDKVADKYANLVNSGNVKVQRVITTQQKELFVILVIDFTGSMGPLIDAVRKCFTDVISRVSEIADGTEVTWQIYGYRDYGSSDIIQRSEKTKETGSLIQWLNNVYVSGGGANGGEAIEVPLGMIINLPEDERPHLCVLAGDERSHNASFLREKSVKSETAPVIAKKFGEAGIPIFSYAIKYRDYDSRLKETLENFAEISENSGGQCATMETGNADFANNTALSIISLAKGKKGIQEFNRKYNHLLSAASMDFGRKLLTAGDA